MPSADPYDKTGIEYFTIPSFTFVSRVRHTATVAYRSFNSSSKKTAMIPTCYGGRINTTPNWTTGVLKDYHVIVVAMLGNGESSAPSNDQDFPGDYSLRYQDCINSQYKLVTEHLGIKSLDVVIGFSMGGQQAYYWAVMHGSGPEPFVKNVVVLCGSAKTSGHSFIKCIRTNRPKVQCVAIDGASLMSADYAFLEGPIAALTTSHDYHGGRYKEKGVKATEGLRAFGRAYAAWLTSPEWFRQELWRDLGAASLKDWLHPPVSGFETWDPEDLLTMGRMWQAGDVGAAAGDGDYRKALEGVTARVMVMPSKTDQYFSVDDGEMETKYLKNGKFNPIPTIWGHIGGGGANEVDSKWIDTEISQFLGEK